MAKKSKTKIIQAEITGAVTRAIQQMARRAVEEALQGAESRIQARLEDFEDRLPPGPKDEPYDPSPEPENAPEPMQMAWAAVKQPTLEALSMIVNTLDVRTDRMEGNLTRVHRTVHEHTAQLDNLLARLNEIALGGEEPAKYLRESLEEIKAKLVLGQWGLRAPGEEPPPPPQPQNQVPIPHRSPRAHIQLPDYYGWRVRVGAPAAGVRMRTWQDIVGDRVLTLAAASKEIATQYRTQNGTPQSVGDVVYRIRRSIETADGYWLRAEEEVPT